MRGLIISNPTTILGDVVELEDTDLDRQELRGWLLLWDKLDFPHNNFIEIGHNAEVQFLIDAGIMQRTRIDIHELISKTNTRRISAGNAITAAFREAFLRHDVAEPGTWAVAHGERSLSFPDADLEASRGLLVKLAGAIPVPNRDVGFEDILAFKRKRAAELEALRNHIEDVYQSVLAAPDRPLAQNSAVGRIARAAGDHLKATRETRFKWRLADVTAKFNITSAAVTGLTTFYASGNLATAALAGTIAGASINVGPTLGLKDIHRNNAFEYVSRFHQELFWE